MMKAGILSDTHLSVINEGFINKVTHCFSGCDLIVHAGDLTNISILQAFQEKTVYGVHGNMCDHTAYQGLPATRSFRIGNFSFGLTHGAGLGHDIETRLFDLFPEADCLIYGHIHRPVVRWAGRKLIINPGSFLSTGRYGSPGTYALLEIGETLSCTIREAPSTF